MNTTINVHLSSDNTHRTLWKVWGNWHRTFRLSRCACVLDKCSWTFVETICRVPFHCSIIRCVLIHLHPLNCMIWARISKCTFQVTTHTHTHTPKPVKGAGEFARTFHISQCAVSLERCSLIFADITIWARISTGTFEVKHNIEQRERCGTKPKIRQDSLRFLRVPTLNLPPSGRGWSHQLRFLRFVKIP